jgi:hypothetical protein
MSEWQPIDTAPKDGTWVLLCGGVAGGYEDNRYDFPWPPMVVAHWEARQLFGGYWVFAAYDGFCELSYENPTHWMPAPIVPAFGDV